MEHLTVGLPAPPFATEDIDGRPVELEGLRGKIVLLEFWSTTCGPCYPEIPHLKQVVQELGDDGVVLGISLDRESKALRKILEQEAMSWPQLFDGLGFRGEIPKRYNINGIPSSYLIGSDGDIVAKGLRGEELIVAVRELLRSELEPVTAD